MGLASYSKTAEQSVATVDLNGGYELREVGKCYSCEKITENALRIAGALVILAGYVQWFIPADLLRGDPIIARTFLTVLFMGTGLAIYLFGSRGFRKVVRLDFKARELTITRQNSKHQSMVGRTLAMADIESLVVKRASAPGAQAVLEIRMKRGKRTVSALSACQQDLELAHLRLCRDIRAALDEAPKRRPKRPNRKARAKTPRPEAKLSAV